MNYHYGRVEHDDSDKSISMSEELLREGFNEVGLVMRADKL